MNTQDYNDYPAREARQEFIPIKVVVVDARGRLYLPPAVTQNIFAGIPDDQRQVIIFLGVADAAGMVMLQVQRPGEAG
jgi:hypothetical protein